MDHQIFLWDRAGAEGPLQNSSGNCPRLARSQAFWQVEDLAGLMEALRGRGVVFEEYDTPQTVNGIFVGGGAKAAWFQDSEGNIMALVEALR
jgi:hypothetical protein